MFHATSDLDDFFAALLEQALGRPAEVIGYRFLSGGCINNTLVLSSSEGTFCLKYNEAEPEDLLPAEARGLAALAQAGALPVPKVIGLGRHEGKAWMLMDYLEAARRNADFWTALGQGLALLHGHTAPRFGFDEDNFIGSLPQPNGWLESGPQFFAERRLLVLAGQAMLDKLLPLNLFKDIEALCARLPQLIPHERPALVHGDLWSGNLLTGPDGGPALIDPAVHYGLREAELAFTHLFGGFEEDFYTAYAEAFPLEPGFTHRRDLYNLYPLLVHLNLFGTSYLPGVERAVAKYR